MTVVITVADPSTPDVAPLLARHLNYDAVSPAESRHALDDAGLEAADVTFWVARLDRDAAGAPVGMIALKDLEGDGMKGEGEVKSMHVLPEHRGSGVADRLLDVLIVEATSRGLSRLNLETGSTAPFAAARAFYRRWGFVERAPFAGYREDPYSVFMTLGLAASL